MRIAVSITGIVMALVATSRAAPPLRCPAGTQRRATADEESCELPNKRRHGPYRAFHKNGAVRTEMTFRDGKPDGVPRCLTERGNPVKCVSGDRGAIETLVDTRAELDAANRKAERLRAEKQVEAYCSLDEQRARLEEEYDEKCVPRFYPDEPQGKPCARRVAQVYERRIDSLAKKLESADKALERAYPKTRDVLLARLVTSATLCHCPTQEDDSNYRAGFVRRMKRGACRE